MFSTNLNNKTALVVGGSRGIGYEIVKILHKAGANVAFSASTQESATKAQENLKKEGVDTICYFGDQSKIEEAEAVVVNAHNDLGSIDILVNNAGITRDNLILRMTDEEWLKVINTNLNGIFASTRRAVKYMIKKRFGRVISLSSVVGFSGNLGQANYAATKSAIVAFNKSLTLELSSRNITFNTIAPGFIETDMTNKLPENIKETIKQKIPLQRFGKPEDIAKAVLFLASDMADYITGSTLHVNGGMF